MSKKIFAIPELVLHNVNRLLVKEEDVQGLSGAIKSLLSDAEEVKRFGRVGHEHVQ